jgi:hypothetical protein
VTGSPGLDGTDMRTWTREQLKEFLESVAVDRKVVLGEPKTARRRRVAGRARLPAHPLEVPVGSGLGCQAIQLDTLLDTYLTVTLAWPALLCLLPARSLAVTV